jgi:hypothetical protein
VPVEEDPGKRGDLVVLRLGWRLGARLRAHVHFEYFSPGDFYGNPYWADWLPVGDPQDATFFRVEISGNL